MNLNKNITKISHLRTIRYILHSYWILVKRNSKNNSISSFWLIFGKFSVLEFYVQLKKLFQSPCSIVLDWFWHVMTFWKMNINNTFITVIHLSHIKKPVSWITIGNVIDVKYSITNKNENILIKKGKWTKIVNQLQKKKEKHSLTFQ